VQLGFASAILPELSLEEVFQTAARFEYDCVELMCWPPGKAERRYAGVTHVDAVQVAAEGAKELLDLSEQYQVRVSALSYYPNPLTADQEASQTAIDHLHVLIDAAARAGVGLVNTFVGRDPQRSVDDNWPRFLEVWKPLIEHAETAQVRIGIENCPMLFTADEWPGGKNLATTPAIWERMFGELPSEHFGLNFDPSHLVWQQIDYLRPLVSFADKLFHVHAKDVRVDKDRLDRVGIMAHPLEYHTPKLPGLGDVEWGKFFSVLGDVGYSGPVCVEVEDRVYEDSLEGRYRSLQQSASFLRNFIPKH